MCGRFALDAPTNQIKAQFHLDALFDISPASIGDKLSTLVSDSVFSNVELNFSQTSVAVTPMKDLLSKGIPECRSAALAVKAATEEKLDAWHQTISQWDEKQSDFEYNLPKQAHVIGTKR